MGEQEPADELSLLRAEVADGAHDLSNALGAILNYVAFLAEDLRDDPAAADYLPHLTSAAHRALIVVERLSASGAR
jgi:signal transduction histidine kinase